MSTSDAACPHCARELTAERVDDGVRVSYADEACFVMTGRCPHPSCAGLVATTARSKRDPYSSFGEAFGPLVVPEDVVRWSLLALLRAGAVWIWPSAVLLGFLVMPLWGAGEARRSWRCGGPGWMFFAAGTLLSVVPVLCFARALAGMAADALHTERSARAAIANGTAGGLRLVADAQTYRGSGSGRTMPY